MMKPILAVIVLGYVP